MTPDELAVVDSAVQKLAQGLLDVGPLKRVSKKQREALLAALKPVLTLPRALREDEQKVG